MSSIDIQRLPPSGIVQETPDHIWTGSLEIFSQAVDIQLSPTVEAPATFKMPSSAATVPDDDREAEELVASVLEAMSKKADKDDGTDAEEEEVVHASVSKLLVTTTSHSFEP